MTILREWIDEENLNESFVNKGYFDDAPTLYVEVCVTRINRFVSNEILKNFYNRSVRIRVRT